ncbi:MAG TPA: DUF4384 domain-containing protein, partial [Pyrinomonadaceae bacterium]|nr:DUF4384 domain-containing protein [Pyrinomonadaceae bacterium]
RPCLFVALAFVCAAASARAQQQPQPDEETTRGAFITTRPRVAINGEKKTSGDATTVKKSSAPVAAKRANIGARKGSAKAPVSPATADEGNGDANGDANIVSANGVMKNANGGIMGDAPAAPSKPRPIGLGYTLFTVGDNGEAVRTDPAREFRTGEGVRLALESNTDGYLYIFHTENDGEPVMIYPDVRLGGGGNFVRAHVPFEIPSSKEAEETARWLVFTDPPADERLYVVLSREPLAGVPTGDALSAYCFDTQHACPWHPAPATWAQLRRAQEREQVAVSRLRDQGRAQTADERDATSRGLGLPANAPAPSVIRMSVSSTAPVLVTTIDLIHK